mmetsp:Transcript_4449/g.14408  ORF Transcript_4449/g.14408 Transcript_4449/m.14408 type:complete len:306 (+) Transcript_4449:1433-2350(+)
MDWAWCSDSGWLRPSSPRYRVHQSLTTAWGRPTMHVTLRRGRLPPPPWRACPTPEAPACCVCCSTFLALFLFLRRAGGRTAVALTTTASTTVTDSLALRTVASVTSPSTSSTASDTARWHLGTSQVPLPMAATAAPTAAAARRIGGASPDAVPASTAHQVDPLLPALHTSAPMSTTKTLAMPSRSTPRPPCRTPTPSSTAATMLRGTVDMTAYCMPSGTSAANGTKRPYRTVSKGAAPLMTAAMNIAAATRVAATMSLARISEAVRSAALGSARPVGPAWRATAWPNFVRAPVAVTMARADPART